MATKGREIYKYLLSQEMSNNAVYNISASVHVTSFRYFTSGGTRLFLTVVSDAEKHNCCAFSKRNKSR